MQSGTYVKPSGQRVVVSQVDEHGERYDLEYLDHAGEATRYRPNMPRLVMRDLETQERWARVRA